MSASDEVIMRAAAGDRAAQESIYRLLSSRVFRTVVRIVGQADADDVTQDIFVNIFRKMHTFRSDSDFATWAHRLAVNDALQHLRRARKRITVPLDEAQTASGETGHGLETSDLVEKALSRLNVELRLIVQLKEIDGMAYDEIAKVLGIPEGTVGSRLNRARRELRAHMVDLGWEK